MMRGMWHGQGGGPRLERLNNDRAARRAVSRRVMRLFLPYKVQIGWVVMAILFTAGLGVANPLLIKYVFDHAIFCHGCPDLKLLYILVAVMVAIPVVTGVVGVGQSYLANLIGQRMMRDVRNDLYAHLQGMSLRFFTGTRTGEIQSRLTNDVGGVQTVVTETASSILNNVVVLISTLVAMTLLSWQLTVLSLALVPVFLVLTNRAGKARRRISGLAQESKAEMSAITEETLSVSGMLLSKVFGRQREEQRRFSQENERLADLAVRREMVGRLLFAVVGIFFSIATPLVYLAAGLVIARGGANDITAGTVVAFTTLQARLFFPIGQMLQVSVEIQSSMALFDRIFEYLDMEHDIVDAPDARVLDPATVRGEVELKNVSFRYPSAASGDFAGPAGADGETPRRALALDDLSLQVKPGQLAAIVGPSGAGKTTISYLIPRLYDVSSGAVLLDGIDVRQLAMKSISELVSMVTQETYLFHASVRANLLYARPDATQEELETAAKAAFIHDRIMQLSNGYDTLVGERGYRLSGGEKQRLAIARVALRAPRVLILDEATSALDTTSERLVQAALRPLMQGRTTIAIAHRLSTILAADVIFVIDGGRVVERGTHAELVALNGLYAQLYQQQFEGGRVEAHCEDGLVLTSGEVLPEEAGSPT
jgi:ATP-binding cassette subfamily B protein